MACLPFAKLLCIVKSNWRPVKGQRRGRIPAMRAALHSMVLVFTLSPAAAGGPRGVSTDDRRLSRWRRSSWGDSVVSGAGRSLHRQPGRRSRERLDGRRSRSRGHVSHRGGAAAGQGAEATGTRPRTWTLRRRSCARPSNAIRREWPLPAAGELPSRDFSDADGARDLAASLGPEGLPWLAGTRQQAAGAGGVRGGSPRGGWRGRCRARSAGICRSAQRDDHAGGAPRTQQREPALPGRARPRSGRWRGRPPPRQRHARRRLRDRRRSAAAAGRGRDRIAQCRAISR